MPLTDIAGLDDIALLAPNQMKATIKMSAQRTYTESDMSACCRTINPEHEKIVPQYIVVQAILSPK
jgi:hypothetical protein